MSLLNGDIFIHMIQDFLSLVFTESFKTKLRFPKHFNLFHLCMEETEHHNPHLYRSSHRCFLKNNLIDKEPATIVPCPPYF